MIKDKEINSIVQQLQTSWNKGSGEGYAAPFTDDADFINVLGQHHTGKMEIAKGHQMIFDTIYKGSNVTYTLGKVRHLTDNISLAFLSADLTFYPGGKAVQIKARPTLTLQKTGDKVQIASVQNTTVGTPPNLESHPHRQ